MTQFRRAGLTVLMGSAAGMGVALALTPVLSRLVTPGVFGTFMTLSAVASVFVGMSTMRLETAGHIEEHDHEAANAFSLGLTIAVGLGAIITLVTWLGWLMDVLPGIAIAIGPMVVLASTQLIGTASLVRRRRYAVLARSNFVQGGGMAIAQTGLAAISPTVGSLLGGYLLARLTWIRYLPRLLWRRAEVTLTWSRHRAYALTAGGSAGINSLGGQVPVLAPALFFGDQAAGWFAMAVRILVSPLSVVGQAAAAAAVGEISDAMRTNDGRSRVVFRRGVRDLTIIGAVPALGAAFLGSAIVPLLLGSEWKESGTIVSMLALGVWAQFAVSPFSQVLNLSGHSWRLLCWDVGRLTLMVGSFAIPSLLGGGLATAAASYSATLIVLYIAMARMCDRALTN